MRIEWIGLVRVELQISTVNILSNRIFQGVMTAMNVAYGFRSIK